MTSVTVSMKRLRVAPMAIALIGSMLLAPASVSATPDPSSVTIAGSLQSEAGCPGDWDPGCATTHLAYDANDDVWQGTFSLPAGSYDYKAALNDAWDENYGLHAESTAPTSRSTSPSATSVKFYYDHKSHWVTDNLGSVIAVAPGSFQSELGCPGDWDPACLRSWLEDPDGDGIYSFETTALPAGTYDGKVAINEDWTENYGQGGVLGGDNISFTVPADNPKVTFSYDSASHVLSITVAVDHGAPGGPARCRISTSRARIASAPRETGPRRSGTRWPTASSATSTTRRSTTRTSRRSSTSSPTARRSPTSRRAT